jgi:ketosteroid isomerase-like protein
MDSYDNVPSAVDKDRPLPPNLERARQYLAAIENGATGHELGKFFAPDVFREEFPNRIHPQGTHGGLGAILEAAELGKREISKQSFEIHNALVDGDRVAMEVLWQGRLANPAGDLPVGGEMRAHFAIFLEFRDGKIVAQRSYEYFEPF